jgi:hypothetical protein
MKILALCMVNGLMNIAVNLHFTENENQYAGKRIPCILDYNVAKAIVTAL